MRPRSCRPPAKVFRALAARAAREEYRSYAADLNTRPRGCLYANVLNPKRAQTSLPVGGGDVPIGQIPRASNDGIRGGPIKSGAARRRDVADHKRSVFVPVPCVEAVVAILLLPVRRDVVLAMSRTFIFALDPGVGMALCVELVIPRHDHIACTCGHLLVDRSGWRNIDVESDACRLRRERGREGSRDGKSQQRFPDVHGNSLFDWGITSLCCGSAGARQRLSSSRVVRCREPASGTTTCAARGRHVAGNVKGLRHWRKPLFLLVASPRFANSPPIYLPIKHLDQPNYPAR